MQLSIQGLVLGRVQGVGFRNFVRHHAKEAGVVGYARNLPNGDVEVLLQGTESAVEAVKKRVISGPPGSFVDHIEWEAAEVGLVNGFRVE